ncbi:hypothetical protein EI290_13725 [Hymenobacter metallilatus]|uniref:DUF3575 domain-containing protein n=2 Tax=Hymenobacter metallilatus TaxID=2493666 RepID=A0A428JEU8_9BACT|nr:hypothetical protein EI290_13725 [Hymenobacter metallilatus]
MPAVLAMLAPHLVTAQTTDTTTATQQAQPAAAGSGTLVRLGTGLTRGFELGGYRGLSVPLVLGLEHHVSSAVSVYANAFGGMELGRRTYFDGPPTSFIGDYGLDLGVKYYYNQEKRRQKGRVTGSFEGNYLALHSNSTFNPDAYRTYRYSTLTVVWGMQRRIGKYGWFEAYVGGGIGREPGYTYNGYYGPTKQAAWFGFAPELGIKFSLGSRLTSH